MAYMKDSTGRRLDSFAVVDKATLKVGTKRAVIASGAQGSTTAFNNPSTSGTGTIRVPFRLSVKTTRYRIKVRNYNGLTQVGGAATTGKGISFGLANTTASAYDTGQFAGAASTSIVSSDFTIPVDGSYYATSWITDPAQQVNPHREYLVALAFAGNAVQSIPRGTGISFWFPDNITTGLNSNGSPTSIAATPFDIQIEYEFEGDQRVGLYLGDSITEGVGGKYDDVNTAGAQPTYRSWPQLYAARSHSIAVDLAIAGTTAAQWATINRDVWQRFDLTTTVPDFGYIGFGSNDANASTTLAQFKIDYKAVLDNMRTKIGNDKPIYLGTITPRTFDAPREALRIDYNKWIRTMPYGVAGVIDFDAVMRDPAAVSTIPTEFVNSDNTHPSRAGYIKMAMAVPTLSGP